MVQEDTVINVRGLSKVYRIYEQPIDRLKETFHPFKQKYHKDFYALKNIDLTVAKGESIGIVGKNGAGKSTLLQVITGVLTPTEGHVQVQGKISALLELGAGFNPELSGIENIFFKGSILGFSQKNMEAKLDNILSFADIGDFVYQPVKTYSSGMYVRLAFAVAIHVEPDVLIVDEALAVGDFRFKQKCLRKIEQFRKDGRTILFVSHDQSSIIKFCNRAVWLLDGQIKEIGAPGEVCRNYIAYTTAVDQEKAQGAAGQLDVSEFQKAGVAGSIADFEWSSTADCEGFGEGGAKITDVCLALKGQTDRLAIFEGGESVVFAVKIHACKNVDHPIVGFHVYDQKGIRLFGLNNIVHQIDLGQFKAGETYVVEFEFEFPSFRAGEYSFSPAVAEGNLAEHVQHHWVHDAYVVSIATDHDAASMGDYLVIRKKFEIRVK